MLMAAASYYFLISFLGVPFFAVFAVLEKGHNPLLTRDSTQEQIDSRVTACITCAIICFFTAVALGAYIKMTNARLEKEKRSREFEQMENFRR